MFLELSKKSLDYTPKKGEKVYIRRNSNIATGGICEDFTSRVHKSVISICRTVLEAFHGLPYAGIDFMTKDITAKQDNNSYCIIEVNSVPGIQMHMTPAIGQPQNVAAHIADIIFPETKIK
jgi:cyanophycin synthetase